CLLEEERVIVDESPGTTRDSIDTTLHFDGKTITLIDTAGIRHQRKDREPLDIFSRSRTVEAIRRSDICIMMLNAVEGILADDVHIFQTIQEFQKGCVIAVNKYDVAPLSPADCRKIIAQRAPFLRASTLVVCSARTAKNVAAVVRAALATWDAVCQEIPQALLGRIVKRLAGDPDLANIVGQAKIHYIRQIGTAPLTFVVIVNKTEYVRPGLLRFLENEIRRTGDVAGAPLRLYLKKKEKKNIKNKSSRQEPAEPARETPRARWPGGGKRSRV
ncbi:MAG: GTP-binding protein, partial [Candidatus Omnitrophica bacterium]|nr:GTP-binding protein [Candidatus Omnitrophota bacterium]